MDVLIDDYIKSENEFCEEHEFPLTENGIYIFQSKEDVSLGCGILTGGMQPLFPPDPCL